MTVIEKVMKRLGFKTQVELSNLLNIDRSCINEWKKRLDGGIPTRHWPVLMDEAERQGKKLTVKELRG